MKLFRTAFFVFLLTLFVSSCAWSNKQVVLYPIDSEDIVTLPATSVVTIKTGTQLYTTDEKGKQTVSKTWDKDEVIVIDRQGYFLSDFYLQEVAEAKVKE